jgi:hypothetical protein
VAAQQSLPLGGNLESDYAHNTNYVKTLQANDVRTMTDTKSSVGGIDAWSDEVISSNFDNNTLGRLLNRCIDSFNSIEPAVAFAAIIAKAKIARKRRSR